MGYFKIKRDILSPVPLITWFIKSQAQLHIYSSSEAVLTPKDDLQSLSAQLTCTGCAFGRLARPLGEHHPSAHLLCFFHPLWVASLEERKEDAAMTMKREKWKWEKTRFCTDTGATFLWVMIKHLTRERNKTILKDLLLAQGLSIQSLRMRKAGE